MGALMEMRHHSKSSSLLHAGVAQCSQIMQSCKSRTLKTPVECSAIQKKSPAVNTNFVVHIIILLTYTDKYVKKSTRTFSSNFGLSCYKFSHTKANSCSHTAIMYVSVCALSE